MAFVYLATAILAEIIGTTSLKYTEGFTRLAPTLLTLASYGAAIFFLARSLERGMQIGIAYALWSGIGVFAITLIGVFFLGEPFTVMKFLGIGLIIGGVVTLSLTGVQA